MQKLKRFLILRLGLFLGTIGLPIVAQAQAGSTDTWGELFPTINQIGGVLPTTFNSIPQIVGNLIRIMLIFAGLVVLIYLIAGGYQYATAGGNSEQAANARTTILNAIIGIVIIFAAYAVATWIMGKFLGTTTPTPTP